MAGYFAEDPRAQAHAQAWAEYTLVNPEPFLGWLLAQSPEDQEYIACNGYDTCRRRFEEEHPI